MSISTRPQGARSISQFCEDHNISRATFYNLIRQGIAPKTFKVGRRRLISDEAAAVWRKQLETASDA